MVIRKRRMLIWVMVITVAIAGSIAGQSLGWFGLGPSAGAEEPVIRPAGDTYTMSARPEDNAGSEPELRVGVSPQTGVAVAYLRFALSGSGIPADAELQLELAEPSTAHGLLEISRVDPMWSEDGLVAAEAPPYGGVLDTVVIEPGTTAVRFDVTRAVRPGRLAAFAVSTPSTGEQWRLHSREADTGGPVLRVTMPAVPTDVPSGSPTQRPAPGEPEGAPVAADECVVGDRLVPSCGALLGVAPGAHVPGSKTDALLRFEELTGKRQHIYHGYHRGRGQLFPTPSEIDIATDPENPRILFLNWKPRGASWAQIAAGHPETDAYLDRLAEHIGSTFGQPMFFTVHHEPEDDVRAAEDSGYTAADYAAMFRHVIERLRAGGADNLVSVMVYMAYLKWTAKPWHDELYPGDDVVDWVGWDTYGYSDPGHGHGDFADIVNRVSNLDPDWPGFYNWASVSFPDKPLMVAEWGVWYSKDNPLHQARVFDDAAHQMAHYPRLKAVVYFESENAEGRDSRVDGRPQGLDTYRTFADSKHFAVKLRH